MYGSSSSSSSSSSSLSSYAMTLPMWKIIFR